MKCPADPDLECVDYEYCSTMAMGKGCKYFIDGVCFINKANNQSQKSEGREKYSVALEEYFKDKEISEEKP
jgi:hypothetical protein